MGTLGMHLDSPIRDAPTDGFQGGPYSEVYGQNLATPALDIASWIAEEKYYNYVKA